ncbi:PREDICTED: mediator of RNA polymerase II transcription subunit 27-like [Chinchilla lanigera]|uniref:mediator of RNA polymerase II transcription subunit 27-like n=1 Tax=Chinchilla lanigera TaxID=34839 RepID=UPI0006967728|nr:PREDICTED: mediator of RNA polymerase II transcription subunit 27-like [Chinchilla lanigera]
MTSPYPVTSVPSTPSEKNGSGTFKVCQPQDPVLHSECFPFLRCDKSNSSYSVILEVHILKLLLMVLTSSPQLDIWSKSNYQVFQKVTDHATTALLHYQLPQMPDVVVRSFMTWLRSYIKLFQAPCQRCGKFLQDGLPPTWRDFRTLEAFHDTCRQ